MNRKSAHSLWALLTVAALVTASLAQSARSLPGCEPVPEVKKALLQGRTNSARLRERLFASAVNFVIPWASKALIYSSRVG